jgi:hypothetical protein
MRLTTWRHDGGKVRRYVAMRLFWVIEGYDSLRMLFSHRVPVAALTQRQAEQVLRCLCAKHALSDAEIIGSLAKRGSAHRMELLDVEVTSEPSFMMSCGSNPYVIARIDPSFHGPDA